MQRVYETGMDIEHQHLVDGREVALTEQLHLVGSSKHQQAALVGLTSVGVEVLAGPLAHV